MLYELAIEWEDLSVLYFGGKLPAKDILEFFQFKSVLKAEQAKIVEAAHRRAKGRK